MARPGGRGQDGAAVGIASRAVVAESTVSAAPTMKPTHPSPKKNFTADLQVFDRQPAATKEIAILKDRAEKATGPERVALDEPFPAHLPSRAPRPVQFVANA